ncbi:MAG: methyltransferase domain-containing protein [Chloroflexota bacterium]
MTVNEPWQLRGNAAELYEKYLVPTLFIPWGRELLSYIALKPGDRVLDIACGPGSLTRLVAPQLTDLGQVVGFDLNAEMLYVARAQLNQAATWCQGDVVRLPFADASMDVVLCQQSFQFFPDKLGALQEMRRMLKKNGRFALNVSRSLAHNIYIRTLANALERHLDRAAGDSMRAPCHFGEAAPLRELMNTAGFQNSKVYISILTIRHPAPAEFITGQLAATPVASQIDALPETQRTALIQDICDNLLPYTDDSGLAVPYEIHIAVASS